MKRYIKIWLAVLWLTPLLSCEKLDDFLDKRPTGQSIFVQDATGDSVGFASASEVESALAGLYSEFRNEYWELDYFVNGDAQSDDAYAGADNTANFQIDEYRITAVNANVSRDWAYLYSSIGKANLIINYVDAVTDMTQERRDEVKGEASFIRAFHYFQLVQLWGDVPLQLTQITTVSAELLPIIYPIMFPARSPVGDVYAQIIKDFELAAQNTPATPPSGSNKGYVTKGAAQAMLAKVYATKEPKEWNKVLEYCDLVINGPYSLVPEFDQLWNNQQENTSESIFEINYEGTSSSGNWGVSMFNGTDWKKFNTPSNDLIEAFDAEGDEIRKNASIRFGDVTGIWTDSYWPSNNFPFINKYRNNTSPSSQNYIFLRLADIMLLKAEALTESGDLQGAADLVNIIRERVDLNPISAESASQMKLAIEKERRLELAFEGHRWFDLKRTGRAIDVISNVSGPDGEPLNYPINMNKLLWPIPQSELDNNGNLVQNPGY